MWTPENPIKELQEYIRDLFAAEASFLLNDLNANKHQVTCNPAEKPKFKSHKVHALEHSNPEWYSELYRTNPHLRRDRSLSALERIINLEDKPYYEFKHKKEKLEYIFVVSRKTKKGKYRKKPKVKQIAKPIVKSRYGYDLLYRSFILERLTQGYKQDNYLVPPNEDVASYFLMLENFS